MAFEVKVYVALIALVLFLALRRGLFPKGTKTLASYLWPIVLAVVLALFLWVFIAVIWSFLL